MAKARFEYRGDKRSADDIARSSKEGTRDFDSVFKRGMPIFKPHDGENCIRIMPATYGEPEWDYVVYSHYDVGPDNARYLCVAKMKGENCPICAAQATAADEDERDKLSPRKGAICWLVDRDNMKAGPQLWSIPFTKVRNEVLTRSVDKKTRAPILIDHPDDGFDVVFNKEGKGDRTNYTGVEISRDPSPLHDDVKIQDKWLDYIEEHPLTEVLNFYDPEYIEKILFGKASARRSADEEEDESTEAPARTSRRSAAPAEEEETPPETTTCSRRRSEPEAVEEEQPERRTASRRGRVLEDAEEVTATRSSRRSLLRDETPEEEAEDTDETAEEGSETVRSARASLGRLKDRRSRS